MADFDRTRFLEVAAAAGVSAPDDERDREVLAELGAWMSSQIDQFVAQVPDAPPPTFPSVRQDLGAVKSQDDPLNAFVRWVDIGPATPRSGGVLSGVSVALKDLISLAGVPLRAGSDALDYVPRGDAVLVRRLLNAGARIVAVTNLEGMAFGGSGESSDFGPTRNPFDLDRSPSGSSGGSAAALFYEGVDLAFGTDQGGSIRLPASWCGVLGLKPTHGAIPYTGILGHDPSFDHVGPMARDVWTLAAALHVSTGGNPSGPGELLQVDATAPTTLKGRRLGVLRESLRAPTGRPQREALAAFDAALGRLSDLGAEVVEVSVPEHQMAGPLLFAGLVTGIAATYASRAAGMHVTGERDRAVGQSFAALADGAGVALPPSYRAAVALGEYLRITGNSDSYVRAQAFIPTMRAAYDHVLQSFDAIVLPATPRAAMRLRPDLSVVEREMRSFSLGTDTPAFNATGHPALSMPATQVGHLPLGVMLVGRHGADADLLRIARTYERAHGWLPAVSPSFAAPPHLRD